MDDDKTKICLRRSNPDSSKRSWRIIKIFIFKLVFFINEFSDLLSSFEKLVVYFYWNQRFIIQVYPVWHQKSRRLKTSSDQFLVKCGDLHHIRCLDVSIKCGNCDKWIIKSWIRRKNLMAEFWKFSYTHWDKFQ